MYLFNSYKMKTKDITSAEFKKLIIERYPDFFVEENGELMIKKTLAKRHFDGLVMKNYRFPKDGNRISKYKIRGVVCRGDSFRIYWISDDDKIKKQGYVEFKNYF